jgi:hypothetical protein
MPRFVEEAGLEQCLNGIPGRGLAERVADLDRQVIENRARRVALQAIDPDVLDQSILDGLGECGRHQPGH